MSTRNGKDKNFPLRYRSIMHHGRQRFVKVTSISLPDYIKGKAKGTIRRHWEHPEWVLCEIKPLGGEPDDENPHWYFADDPEKKLITGWKRYAALWGLTHE